MSRSTAFTLVEVMISVAVVLILMLGISRVFEMAADTVAGGQALASGARDYRALQDAMVEDISTTVTDSPLFVITNQRSTQYLHKKDAATGLGGWQNPLYRDLNGNGVLGEMSIAGEWSGPYEYFSRSHRVDTLSFFVRGTTRRQTANDGGYVSPTTGFEAYVTYAHLRTGLMAGNTGYGDVYCPERYPQNTMNFADAGPDGGWIIMNRKSDWRARPASEYATSGYASDWMIGRNVVLLRDRASIPAGEVYFPRASEPPISWSIKVAGQADRIRTINLTPLGAFSPDSAGGTLVDDSRYDLAQTTVEEFRQVVAEAKAQERVFYSTYTQANGYSPFPRIVRWWHPMVFLPQPDIDSYIYNAPYGTQTVIWCGHPAYQTQKLMFSGVQRWIGVITNPPQYHFRAQEASSDQIRPPVTDPRDDFTADPCSKRFRGSPGIMNPISSRVAARAAPVLLQRCSQFVVEYAGDYLTQDNNGDVTAAKPDGQVDWVARTVNGNTVRQVRFYGLPRDLDGDGRVLGFVQRPDGSVRPASQMIDVVPLRDLARTAPGSRTPPTDPDNPGDNRYYGMPFERDVESLMPVVPYRQYPTSGAIYDGDYGLIQAPGWGSANPGAWSHISSGLTRYVCIWENDTPAMVRVVVETNDPTDRLHAGYPMETVLKLK